jgi:hypothetical protein
MTVRQIADPLIEDTLAADLAATALAMARRFEAGATLWAAAPSWPPHAHHIAVEFVHPVIVGKRALPAFVLDGPEPAAQGRVLTRGGDLLIVVARADDRAVRELLHRAPAWGTTAIWIGSGPRPAAGAADHVLWLDTDDPSVPLAGGYVQLYHLLWELTHVCFEHPGLLTPPVDAAAAGQCVTCADEGRLAEVVSRPVPGGPALVRAGIGQEHVDTTLVGEVAPGDLLLIHAGFAISRLDGG